MKDTQPARVRLGVFELDLMSGELSADDWKTVLQEQPLQVLRMLVEAEGDLVSREEIKKKLWRMTLSSTLTTASMCNASSIRGWRWDKSRWNPESWLLAVPA
jgi:DNA-binding winged helix-turn-helix (wHTH) protein